jgi:solute carrier family 25 carnitine/acylcarnitine transporter 20/29
VLKSRLQVQVASGPGNFLGPLATLRLLVASPLGLRALYAGWLPLVCRDVPGYALLYSVFVHSRAAPSLAAVPTWCLGGASGVAFYLATLPVDRVKTVMMTQALERPAFASPREALAEIVSKDGLTGLYRGCAPTLVRTFAGQAAALAAYEWARAAA